MKETGLAIRFLMVGEAVNQHRLQNVGDHQQTLKLKPSPELQPTPVQFQTHYILGKQAFEKNIINEPIDGSQFDVAILAFKKDETSKSIGDLVKKFADKFPNLPIILVSQGESDLAEYLNLRKRLAKDLGAIDYIEISTDRNSGVAELLSVFEYPPLISRAMPIFRKKWGHELAKQRLESVVAASSSSSNKPLENHNDDNDRYQASVKCVIWMGEDKGERLVDGGDQSHIIKVGDVSVKIDTKLIFGKQSDAKIDKNVAADFVVIELSSRDSDQKSLRDIKRFAKKIDKALPNATKILVTLHASRNWVLSSVSDEQRNQLAIDIGAKEYIQVFKDEQCASQISQILQTSSFKKRIAPIVQAQIGNVELAKLLNEKLDARVLRDGEKPIGKIKCAMVGGYDLLTPEQPAVFNIKRADFRLLDQPFSLIAYQSFGQQNLSLFKGNYLKDAHVAVIAFAANDLSMESFINIEKKYLPIFKQNPDVPILLVGKEMLRRDGAWGSKSPATTYQQREQLAEKIGAFAYVEIDSHDDSESALMEIVNNPAFLAKIKPFAIPQIEAHKAAEEARQLQQIEADNLRRAEIEARRASSSSSVIRRLSSFLSRRPSSVRGHALAASSSENVALEDDEIDHVKAEKYISRAEFKYRQGDPAKALYYYGQAIKVNPESIEAYQKRGDIYCELGDHAKGKEDYKKAQSLKEAEPQSVDLLDYDNSSSTEVELDDYDNDNEAVVALDDSAMREQRVIDLLEAAPAAPINEPVILRTEDQYRRANEATIRNSLFLDIELLLKYPDQIGKLVEEMLKEEKKPGTIIDSVFEKIGLPVMQKVAMVKELNSVAKFYNSQSVRLENVFDSAQRQAVFVSALKNWAKEEVRERDPELDRGSRSRPVGYERY